MITFRRYELRDAEAVQRLHRVQEAALGRRMDFPDLAMHPVLVAEVGEKNGEIVGAHYLESTPEYVTVGRSPEFTAAAIRRAPAILSLLRSHEFRVVRVIVPDWLGKDTERITEALRDPLVGAEIDEGYRHLLIDLRPQGEVCHRANGS